MKKAITLWVFFLLFATLEQAYSARLVLRYTYFDDGRISDTKEKVVEIDSMLTWEQYSKVVARLRLFPRQLIDKRYKNQSITVWADSTRAKDIETNWSDSYTYDSLSRLVYYLRGSCLLCGSQAYQLHIAYDQHNRPISISMPRFILRTSRGTNSDAERYEFVYDEKGAIIQMRFYEDGRLEEQIDTL